jgi:anti-sigma factor RsiW
MRCELIRELIFSDYTDGELGSRFRSEIDAHIRTCAACAELARKVAEEAAAPVRSAARVEPPQYLWERVKARVEAEESARRGAAGAAGELLWRSLRALQRVPKGAVAFAAAAAVIIAVLVARPMALTRTADEYISEQMEFVTSLGAQEANGGYFEAGRGLGADNMI